MTIKDIAKQCSVSVSTVSRVLNDRPDVSEDVRRKVLSAIKNSNYIPNNSARDLVRTKSDAVGLVVRGVSNPFYTDIIRAIERTITDAGFTMVMQQIGTCDDEVKCGAVMEREKRLQGIVFLGGRFDYTPADLAMLNVPFVCCSYSNRYGTLIEGEYISAVFVKDLSRLGRNYIEVGKLTEEFFPLHDVRLVAVSDGVDSDEGEDDFTPFKNIMNEYYAKDISKKRRIVNKMKGNAGIPLSPPPYGYIKNPDDPRFWVIDPEAAEVVRRIYRMALDGYGLAETAAALGADGIVNPTYYWRSRGTSRGGSKSTVEPTKWGHTTIKKILTTQEYCGDVINFKSYSKSYKMKRRIENPEENRAIFLNVHEPIIDRPTWEKVQALKAGTRRKRPTVTQEPSVFSGYLKCPECGGNLNFHFNQGNHDIKFFSCQNHNSGLRKCSSTHYIRLDFLEQVVLYEIHRLACFANEYENDFIKAMVGRSAKVAENDRVRKKRELDGLLARDGELDMLFERLYEDNVSGKIDDARFAKMSKRYEQEQGENAKKIKALRLELKKLEDKRMDVDTFLETVRRYTDATTITKRMVAELIEYIEVYPAVKEDGVTNQRVTIHYNCIGAFEVPDRRKIPERDILLETRKGVALSYAPAV